MKASSWNTFGFAHNKSEELLSESAVFATEAVRAATFH